MHISMKILASLGVVVGAALPTQASLVAHYTFDGDNAQDASGNGHNGTAIGGVSYVTGIVGSKAAHFDGTGVIEAPYSTDLSLGGTSYTVALWASLSALQPQALISGSDNQADFNGGYTLATRSSGFLSIHNTGTSNSYDFPSSSFNTDSALNNWTHFALVYDKVAGTRTLYANGVAVESIATTADLVDRGFEPLRLGSLFNGDIGYFYRLNGSLDDVRIYNEALSSGGVAALVPEPSIIALAGLGLAGLVRRRRAAR